MRLLRLTLVSVAALCAAADEPLNPVTALPAASPEWLPGYGVRYVLQVVGDRSASKSQSITASVPTGGWAGAAAADLTVQTSTGEVLSAAVLSHVPTDTTLLQFPRHGDDIWYWVYTANPAATAARSEPLPEGLTVEVREWQGDHLDSWPAVREGLAKSPLLGCYPVAEVLQSGNPARPGVPRSFAASYRGLLNIEEAGLYRFFVNAEDASFLFIDGYKVCDRPGSNVRIRGRIPTNSVGTNIELTAGAHPFEVHQVTSDNPGASGICTLLWLPPGATAWTFVPRTAFVQGDYARVAAVETVPGTTGAAFVWGIDDTLLMPSGLSLSLIQFAAHGSSLPEAAELHWDFGDGTAGSGANPAHVYFAEGDYLVSLTSGALPPFKRRVHVWPAPGMTSPFSAARVIQLVGDTDWRQLGTDRLSGMFDFLQVCDQPNRWSLLAQITGFLLEQEQPDPQYRASLYCARVEALAQTGREADALALVESAIPSFGRLRSAQVRLRLAAAAVHHRQLRETAKAAEMYRAILTDFDGFAHPTVRVAAIRWGDLCAESGDLAQAGEHYRAAGMLGGEELQTTAQADAVTRGALLRVAEQRLRSGDIRETRALLERIELHYPEQKLGGLYRFLRAETDRIGGRYEEALQSYEVLLRLSQWSGFHDRAMFGVADSYYRMRDYERSRAWLSKLQEAYPKYYETAKCDVFAQVIDDVMARMATGTADFADAVTGFEPDEPQSFGDTGNFSVVPGLGMDGAHVLALDGYPGYRNYLEYQLQLPNLSGDAYYWVEMWYRESLLHSRAWFAPHIHTFIYGRAKDLNAQFHYEGTSYFDRTFGQWRKFGFMHKSSMTLDGHFAASVRQIIGVMEFDHVSIRRVTDRQYDALANLLDAGEGAAE